MKLVIGNKNYSSWPLRAWLFLSANNIAFEEIRILLDRPDTHTKLSKFTEAAKVPVRHDDDLIIWDSLAICEYISDKYLADGGWPKSLEIRAEARAAAAEMHSGFFHLREAMPMNCRATGRKVEMTAGLSADINRIDQLWSKLRVKHTSDGTWLVGQFSIADCMFAPVAFRFQTYGVSVSEIASEYMQTLLNHESMQRWLKEAMAETEVLEREEAGKKP